MSSGPRAEVSLARGSVPPHCLSYDLATRHRFRPQYVSADSMRGTVDGVDVLHSIAARVSCLTLVRLASKAVQLPTIQRHRSCTAPKICLRSQISRHQDNLNLHGLRLRNINSVSPGHKFQSLAIRCLTPLAPVGRAAENFPSTCAMFQARTALPSDSTLHSDFMRIISYLPTALYAESLRVRSALIRSVSTPSTVAPALTGCVRDLGELWDMTAFDLFEDFGKTKTYNVASLRHGNSFQLANRGLLEIAGLIKGHKRHANHAQIFQDGDVRRYTTVHVRYMTPIGLSGISDETEPPSWLPGVCQAVVVLEVLLEISIGAAMGAFGVWDGLVLMGCMVVNALVLLFLQRKTSIIFANVNCLKDDKKRTAADGAALDIHVISESWNSCHLDVLAGYSSQLHALTNLPVWTTASWTIPVASRILSVVLLIQAAVLTSLMGASGVDAVVPMVWLAVHALTLIPPALIHRKYPNAALAPQPATVYSAGTLHFRSRSSALAFIAMLPVASKVPRWDWLDVFMPNNKRRQEWQEDLETSEIIAGGEPKPRNISAAARTNLEEAMVAYRSRRLSKYLSAYKQTVRAT